MPTGWEFCGFLKYYYEWKKFFFNNYENSSQCLWDIMLHNIEKHINLKRYILRIELKYNLYLNIVNFNFGVNHVSSMLLSYRNESNDFQCNSIKWFLRECIFGLIWV